jgi:hypothetical protein
MNTGLNRISDVPATARGHLGLLFYEAACRLIFQLRSRARGSGKPPGQVFETFPFLSPYWDELLARFPEIAETEDGCAIQRAACRQWEEGCDAWLPLLAVRQQASLSADHVSCLVIAGLAEEDAHFGELFSALQPPRGSRRPTIGLLQALLRAEANPSDAWSLCRPLLESGFLTAGNREGPRAEWELRVPPPLWNAILGERDSAPAPGIQYHPPETFPELRDLILTAGQRTLICQVGELWKTGPAHALMLRGMPGSPRREILGSLARQMSSGLLDIDGAGLATDEERRRLIGPLCTLMRALPVFHLELGPGEVFEVPALAGYAGPTGILAGREGGLSGALADQAITINLEAETPEQRLRYWLRELPDHSAADLSAIAESFTLPGGHICRAAPLAAAHRSLNGRAKITPADVRQAVRTLSRQRLDSLSTRLDGESDWSRIVVAASTETELHALERRCRQREKLATLLDGDLPGGLNRGVRALFEGPSGTGKTLAARVVATELGVDLYRVDLASVVNKYIGETEKNLSRILGRAEDLDVVLLLDEGDSLMSRRTEVKSAHDRYANLETNYLLQRLETYTGIVIVTTNVSHAIDTAFRRRLDVVVKFHLPDVQQRWRLWQVHLPAGHAVPPADLEWIALRCEMTGGQIRNAAIQAALLALGKSRQAISSADLRDAIQIEYRKAGAAAAPAGETRTGNGHDGRLAGFLAAIS